MLWFSAVIVIGLVALVWSADKFVDGASAIAQRAGLTPMMIGLTIVSVGTSAPEILISVMSAWSGSGELAVGNALGSNIANVGLVLGITLLVKSISLNKSTTFIDLPILVLVVLLTGALLVDLDLSRGDSLVLLAALGLFFLYIIRHGQHPLGKDEAPPIPSLAPVAAWLTFLGGLGLLIASSRALVWAASQVAAALGVSELVIGLTIVAVGTSLPELAASVMSALKGQADMAIGAIIGSNMFNLLLVLAIPGFWGTLNLQTEVLHRDLVAVFVTTLVLALAALYGWNRQSGVSTLTRNTGMVLLALYIAYYLWLFMTP
ncbi:calcium/sodium antiporter [Luminiphilus sp.]|nr:calcium/sodium antiporter [Luminiphilus sp.]